MCGAAGETVARPAAVWCCTITTINTTVHAQAYHNTISVLTDDVHQSPFDRDTQNPQGPDSAEPPFTSEVTRTFEAKWSPTKEG